MNFEDLVVLDVANLPDNHPANYLENLIKGKLLKTKEVHDQEHIDMLKHWEYDFEENGDYTFLNARNGHADRFWHIALHLRYWKEQNLNTEHVKEFEDKFPQVKLEEIPLP